jgi:hypothetical protein
VLKRGISVESALNFLRNSLKHIARNPFSGSREISSSHRGTGGRSICLTLAICGLWVSSLHSAQIMGGSRQVALSATSLSFGNVAVNTSASQSISLKSSGSRAVTISSVSVTGAGFSIPALGFPVILNSGQSITLQVYFKPTLAGAVRGAVTISTNAISGSTRTVSLSATGTAPQLGVSASSLSFGTVNLNSTSMKTLTLTSTGTAAVTINSATLSGTGFTMSGITFPATLNPGQSLTMQVSFSPTVTGTASGTLSISSNCASGGTATVAVSGTGMSSNPVLSLGSTSLSFGDDPVGTPMNQSVSVTSTGTSAVTVSAASITGAGFTFSGATFPVTLNPNVAITVQVQFDPAAIGAASGKLTFTSNSSTGATSVVNLSGNGTAIQHQVNLSWIAPVNSPVPVSDYNVYRATGTSTSYQLLSSSTNTAYVDLNVQDNTVYSYYVTSVGNTGTESSPSNQATVTVP